MSRRAAPYVVAIAVGSLVCLGPALQDSAPAHWRDRGAEILLPFKRALKQALQQGLRESPTAAIDACRVRAPEIADALSRDGVRVGRTSHRLRNPANAPSDWQKPLLAAYVEVPARRGAAAVALPGARIGYVEPIHVEALCLTCHGAALSEPVQEAIARHYPDDRATGFMLGDFRGLFWAEFPAGE